MVKEIRFPFERKISPQLWFEGAGGAVGAMSVSFSSIIPYHGSWILTDASSDTIYKFSADYAMTPYMARTPSIQTMTPEVFLFPYFLSDRYYFMETVRKEMSADDFFSRRNLVLPNVQLVYDKQEDRLYQYRLYNGDYSEKRPINFHPNHRPHHNRALSSEIVFWLTLEADDLVEAYEKGELKGKLKEAALGLKEEDNPVIMIVKHKK